MNRKVVTIIVGTLITLSVPAAELLAQGRGRGGGGGGGARMGPPPRAVFNSPPPVVAPRSTFAGHPNPVVGHPTPPFVTAPVGNFGRPFAGSRFRQQNVFPQLYGGFYSPYIWPSSVYPQDYVEPAYSAPVVSQSDVDLQYQVQRLTQEIEQLREEQALNVARQPLPPPAPAPPPTPVTLVFRDGHRMSIENYAIVGQTLWVLDEGSSIRISIADLDVTATQNENRGQGVRLRLPER